MSDVMTYSAQDVNIKMVILVLCHLALASGVKILTLRRVNDHMYHQHHKSVYVYIPRHMTSEIYRKGVVVASNFTIS